LGSKYLLDQKIGQGGMGVVWRGHDRMSGAVYAIKILRPSYASDAVAVARFVRERTALMAFRHPHVVTVHDMIVEGERLALVMDFVPGGDLNKLRRDRGGQVPPEQAAGLAAQIADALAAAHAAGITHRDIKPENVLMASEQDVLLADFGIARLAGQSRDTTTGMVLGTAEYLAPELVSGQEPGPAGDLYSLGATLYELIAGQPPFTGNPAAVLHSHVSAPPKRPAEASDEMWALISRCLAKAPGDRPAAAEAAATLSQLAGDAPVPTPTDPLPTTVTGSRPAWAGPTGPFHEVAMRPLEELTGRPTTQNKRRIPSRTAMIASAAAVLVAIAAVVLINPFKTTTANPAAATGLIASPTATAAAAQPSTAAKAKAKAPKAKPASTTSRQATGGQQSSAPSTGTTTAAAQTSPTTASDNTGWECSADSTQDTTHGKTLKSCIKITGSTVELQGYAWTIPAGLAASGEYEQVEIVLHTPSGDIGHYMSPDCAAGTCEYSVSVTESAGTYWAQADFYWDGSNTYQAGFTPEVTVTG
jgi:serine/threonine-protein kinase